MFVAGETKLVAVAKFFVAEIGLIVSWLYLNQLRKFGLIRGDFVSGEWRKMGAKGWVDEGKAVAGDGFSRAEVGLIGLMVVSESATKILSRSKGVDGLLRAADEFFPFCTGTGPEGKRRRRA